MTVLDTDTCRNCGHDIAREPGHPWWHVRNNTPALAVHRDRTCTDQDTNAQPPADRPINLGGAPRLPEYGEVLVQIAPGARVDEHGRIRFGAWWRDHNPSTGEELRYQVSHCDLDEFTADQQANGLTVTVLD